MQIGTTTTTATTINTGDDAFLNFVTSLDSKVSRKLYANTFPYFMKFCQMDSYNATLQIPVKQLESKIRDYLVYLREDKKVAVATISLYLAGATISPTFMR